jgi:hypothetical protein
MASAHIGQANQMSFANTAQAGTIIQWGSGALLDNGARLGLGGGLLLCPNTLASRALLSDRMAPGASELGWAAPLEVPAAPLGPLLLLLLGAVEAEVAAAPLDPQNLLLLLGAVEAEDVCWASSGLYSAGKRWPARWKTSPPIYLLPAARRKPQLCTASGG